MQSPKHFRDRAAHLRRLAAAVTNLEVYEQLERVASDYEKLAIELELETQSDMAPPTD
jgi:hypothetical protein